MNYHVNEETVNMTDMNHTFVLQYFNGIYLSVTFDVETFTKSDVVT